MNRQKIVNTAGFIGGCLFVAANITTEGKVPGGFLGGALGYIVGAGLMTFVLVLCSYKKQVSARKS